MISKGIEINENIFGMNDRQQNQSKENNGTRFSKIIVNGHQAPHPLFAYGVRIQILKSCRE